jgi:hypothetical protein
VLRNKFLGAPDDIGNFARQSSSAQKGAKELAAPHSFLREFLKRVPVVAPAGSEPWGWQLLRFTDVSVGEAPHSRPGVRSKVAGPNGKSQRDTVRSGKQSVAPKSFLRELFRGTIGKGIAITASASGIGTGAPFAVYPLGVGTGLHSSKE